MTTTRGPIERTRARLGDALFMRIAGPHGLETRKRVHETEGPRWYPPGSPIRRVYGDASAFVGGLRSLLLQSLHPLAMAGVAGHSGYRGDPWGRLNRTSAFLAFTTFGAADDAQATIDRVRAIHDRIRGTTEDGRQYHASDPHLLTWVHIAQIDSFLTAYQRYGERALTEAEADEYIDQAARVATGLGAVEVPHSVAELNALLARYRPELEASPAALDTAHFLLKEPPLPVLARGPYRLIASGAVSLLPAWAQTELKIGGRLNRAVGPLAGSIATRSVRWGMGDERRRRLQGFRGH